MSIQRSPDNATAAGKRLLWMLKTEPLMDGKRWPVAFDARLVERIAEEMVPRIEVESWNAALAVVVEALAKRHPEIRAKADAILEEIRLAS